MTSKTGHHPSVWIAVAGGLVFAFFDGAGGVGHLAVPLAWAVLGVGAIVAGAALRRQRAAAAPL